MRRFAKGIIIVAAGVSVFATVAFADTTTSSDTSKPAAAPPAVTTGSISSEPTFEQRMNECMAIWDKGTHMTKEQWRRSCKTTLQSLSTN